MPQDTKKEKQEHQKKALEDAKPFRLSEVIKVLTGLKKAGVSDLDPSYIESKKQLDYWLQTGEGWQGKIQFPHYGRFLELALPGRPGLQPVVVFKMRDSVKEELS